MSLIESRLHHILPAEVALIVGNHYVFSVLVLVPKFKKIYFQKRNILVFKWLTTIQSWRANLLRVGV
jgi:hypothetical protein